MNKRPEALQIKIPVCQVRRDFNIFLEKAMKPVEKVESCGGFMKHVVFLLFFLFAYTACAQTDPPRLIVRGDDMGFAHSGNVALMKTYTEGIMTSVEVIVPSPWFPEAIKMLAEHPDLDAGIHLTLTSEWDNVKWRPISDAQSIRGADGYFYPMIYPNDNYPGRALKEHEWTLDDIEKEFRAQIEMALRHIPQVTHVSGHMGCMNMSDEVNEMVKALVKEYGIDILPEELGVERARYDGSRDTTPEKIESFIRMLDSLEEGKTYLFVEHPGLDTPELRAISHLGYENVAADRQGVTDMWTDERVKARIRELGIQLISYSDLAD